MTIIRKAALALSLLGATAIAGWHHATVWQPSTKTYPLQGIDLGATPGAVEWGFVRAAGADFAYLAATVGADRRVSSFEANWNALPAAGLRRGAVHLYSLCQPAEAQANAFNTVVPRLADALPAAVDVDFREDCTDHPEPAALVRDVRLFVKMVEAHTGKPVLLRVGKAMDAAYALSDAIHRPIWAKANFLKPDYAARPWRLWRASDMRRIEGVENPVNWDVTAS
ncbi:GH25 family lysozyme [Sphingomonas mollis]|uniref:Glycosyl hydrolase n=1 Tax=Sphingomonas mollis TaxID=2795726 RepID=A0ABS0XPE1_9SPHN|nr:GH25 family lysozyme [Sphingomonas sp. BT553]MBJ6121903.1 glycosyl hydrolase [Sphingomonas sp. BT553]